MPFLFMFHKLGLEATNDCNIYDQKMKMYYMLLMIKVQTTVVKTK